MSIYVYKDICFNDKLLRELVVTSKIFFQNLKAKGKISIKQLKYFMYQYKKLLTLVNSINKTKIPGAQLENSWKVAQSLQKCLQKFRTFFSEISLTLTCLF